MSWPFDTFVTCPDLSRVRFCGARGLSDRFVWPYRLWLFFWSDFGGISGPKIDAKSMKIRIGTSADFGVSFQTTLDCIFGPKMVPKSFKMSIWSHCKNSVFVWKVLQKSRFGTFPWHENSVPQVLRKHITFLVVFGSRFAIIWAPQNHTQCIKNRIEKNHRFFNWFW